MCKVLGVNDAQLLGKTALVTGSGRNIGRAIALELAAQGANLVVNARHNAGQAKAVAAEIRALGRQAVVVMGDAADRATAAAMHAAARSQFGHLDIYVSNAARRLHKSFFDTTDEDWHEHLNMQLTASWYLAKTFVPDMIEHRWGRIVHVNGPDGWGGGWNRIPHSVAKGGLRTLTKSLARGLGEHGITVNDLVPGFAATERDPAAHPQVSESFTERTIAEIPIGRQPSPEEVAWACAFLCSPRSGAINGTALHVDGGWRMLG